MALTIPQILRQFKADVGKAIAAETILKICGYLRYTCRDRVLGPVTTVHVFLLQILHGNTACTALSRLAGVPFTAAAYCVARKRLPLALFKELLEHVCDALFPEVHTTGRWRGHRTWLLDGSSYSMPDTPELRAYFGQPSLQAKGCVASFAHLALLFLRNMHALFRCHQQQIVDFRVGRKHTQQRNPHKGLPRSRYVRRLGHWDQVVEYRKPKIKPKWMDQVKFALLPETLLVRELRFLTPQRGYRTKVITLVTTLLDPVAYPAEALAELYLGRWQIEVNFRHLKTTMGLEVLHCKTVAGVLKEMYMFAITYNLVRLVMLEASRRQQVPLDRISFIDALRWLRDAQTETRLTALVVNPARPERLEPRVLKRRMKEYNLMKKPRHELRKALLRKKRAA